MKISPKITKTRRAKFISYRCSLVNHHRRTADGRPTYSTLASFPAIRSTEVGDLKKQSEFHSALDAELLKQILRGAARADCVRAKEAFSKIIPVPKLTAKSLAQNTTASVDIDPSSFAAKYPILRVD